MLVSVSDSCTVTFPFQASYFISAPRAGARKEAIAVFPYTAQHGDELTLRVGDLITGVVKVNSPDDATIVMLPCSCLTDELYIVLSILLIALIQHLLELGSCTQKPLPHNGFIPSIY